MKRINNFVERFIYEGDKQHPDTFRKGKFFIISMSLMLLLSILSLPFFFSMSVNYSPGLKILNVSVLVVLTAIVLIYPRFGYRILLANLYFIFASSTALYTTYTTSGGIYSPDNFFGIVIIIFIFMVTNRISGYIWSVLSVIMVLGFYYADMKGLADFRAAESKLDANYFLFSNIFSLIFATVLIILHENSKDNYLNEINKAKSIIEQRNTEITESLHYARQIQQAMLPPQEEIFSALPNSFILFKPKDIVSGDFYFFHNNEDAILLAAADCTGHGIPGGFMTMLCSEKLNEAVSYTDNVSEILRQVNQHVRISLRQTGDAVSSRDGMDIAFCAVDMENSLVRFAGANRPLWLIRHKAAELQEIRPTKAAIGGHTADDQDFSLNEIRLGPGDTFYIFSDGYADTFSGETGKKLKTKRFKELLMGIRDKPMNEQQLFLDEFIENWKAGAEQTDDILVIGVRF